MLTMYEKLMMLPIFKGIGPEEMSGFLEKTNLEFGTYDAGSLIVSHGGECEKLICVLSGSIQCIYTLAGGKVKLAVEYGPGKVIGMDRLFGLDTHYSHVVRALNECGTMSFSKNQYMSMLKTSRICTINYMNILSYRCQRAEQAVQSMPGAGITGQLAVAVSVLTDRDCKRILLQNVEKLSDDKDDRALNAMMDKKIMVRLSEQTVEIPSRQALLDYSESIV